MQDYFQNEPLVSIITVVFNSKNLLEKTIQSVINQDYRNVEYIIIDGGSKDGTVDIIKKYNDKIAYWISEPDNGLYDAMNKGIQQAKGDYLWFINSGDQIYSDETLRLIIDGGKTYADVFYGLTVMIDINGKEIGNRRLKPRENLTWKSLRMGMLISHQSIIARKSIIPFYDLKYRFSADFDWMIKVLKKADSVKYTNLILSKFLDGGLTKQNILPGLKERFRIMCNNYGVFPTILRHFIIGIKFLGFVARHKRF